ncbi:O-antigen ligase family protein [Halorubrum ezzemoulense]|uniref:O-antigen ligase family protein n=1 Tax=Halorubrum ezzemoulense TaxID=337243 RepID=UPI00232FC5A2|nr:O-antigen ligase family protein [Halorubrum ezzemoulense]MDB2243105.1 O-antigen ligase family protein [Halorubrum ezzemoulense]
MFSNPNILGILALGGSLATVSELRIRGVNQESIILLLINFIGLLFTNYRSGIFAFIAVIVLLYSYQLGGRGLFSITTVAGLFCVSLFFVLVVSPIHIPLNNRQYLWTAAYNVFLDQPVLGHGLGRSRAVIQSELPMFLKGGPGIDNAYLRMFVALGIIGGVSYIFAILSCVVTAARNATNPIQVDLSVFITAFALIQIFVGYTFIGVFLPSLLIALPIGYHINSDKKSLLDITYSQS